MIGDLKRVWTYARIVRRAMRRGEMFPASTRIAPRPAPGGSRSAPGPRLGRRELDHFVHTEHRFPMAGLARPVRILHLSDLHLRKLDDWTERLADHLSGLQADLVAITGDVVTRGWTAEAAERVLAAIPAAPLGRFAILGNWEYWAGTRPERWRALVEAHGIHFLRDESRALEPFDLVGTDDLLAARPDLDRAFAGVGARPTVVLTHSPAIFPRLVRPGVRLVLAGHTHGGQVAAPLVGTAFLPRASGIYPWGWYQQDEAWMFVSRGIGWSVAPLRLGAPPEIAFIDCVPLR